MIGAACARRLVELARALLQHLRGAEHGAVVLHDPLHLEPELAAVGVAPLAWRTAVEPRERLVAGVGRQRLVRLARLHRLGGAHAPRRGRTRRGRAASWSRAGWRRAPRRRPPRRSPSARARPRPDRRRSSVDDLAVIVGRDAAHVVVHGRQHRDRLLASRRRRRRSSPSRRCRAGARAAPRRRDARDAEGCGPCCGPQPRPSRISIVIERLTTSREARSLAVRRVALHEALALGVGQIAALAARALGDQAAGAVDAGRVELHELHVLQRQAGAQHHRVAVAGAGMRRGAGEIGAAVAAGRQHHACARGSGGSCRRRGSRP